MNKSTYKQHQRRLFKLLAKKRSGCKFLKKDDQYQVEYGSRSLSVPVLIFDTALKRKFIKSEGGYVLLTPEGKSALKVMLTPDETKDGPPRKIENGVVHLDGSLHQVAINVNESPLTRLFHLKQKNGGRFLRAEHLKAGDRLRSDFEKAQLQPSISSNLHAAVAGRSRGGISNSAEELSDFAIDKRKELNSLLGRLGPDLGGVAFDVCCFLKGLEVVEREREWPPRSAKVMLRTALDILVNWYGFGTNKSDRRNISHWGDGGHRPDMFA